MPMWEVIWNKNFGEEGKVLIEADTAADAESEVLDNIDTYDGQNVQYDDTAEATEVD
jgi:hypothetical protein